MRNEGFTLVELLAVIAILAILVILAMPNVLGMFNEAKVNVFVTDVQRYMDAATTSFTKDALNNAGKTIYYSSVDNATLKTKKLNMSGAEKEYFIEIDRNGEFKRVIVFDSNYCYDIFFSKNGIGGGDNSKIVFDKITKTSVTATDVRKSGNDSIIATINGSNYFVSGCGTVSYATDEGQDEMNLLYNVLKDDSVHAKKYEGEHNDSYNRESTHDIYHFYATSNTAASQILNKNNVLFANHCWQMLRTTDTGGIKLLYNGPYDEDKKCQNNRGDHLGFSYEGRYIESGSYYFADNYTYNSNNKKFKLSGNKFSSSWSDSSSLINKYTCFSSSENHECSSLYKINEYVGPSNGRVIIYNANVHYAFIGGTKFNDNNRLLASLGYMLDNSKNPFTMVGYHNISGASGYYAKSIEYRNNKYYLKDYKKIDVTTDFSDLNDYHYRCLDNDLTSCAIAGYVYLYNKVSTHDFYMVRLADGITDVNYAINLSTKTNTRNSNAKFVIDLWYEKNLLNYSNYLEETIYCNNRRISNLSQSGWNPNGGNVKTRLKFGHSSNNNTNLLCPQETDKFSINNPNARLKYSIAMPTMQEFYLLNNKKLYDVGKRYRTMTPSKFSGSDDFYANLYIIGFGGGLTDDDDLRDSIGVRPVISLKSGTKYLSGNGSTTNPYRIN